jgi:hypothetical protein
VDPPRASNEGNKNALLGREWGRVFMMPLDCKPIDLEDDEDLEEVQQIEDNLGFLKSVGKM